MNRQPGGEGAGTGIGRGAWAAALAVVLSALVMTVGGCDRLRREQPDPGADGRVGEAEGIAPARRPDLPARGPGLASLAVFPETSAPLAVLDTQPRDGADGVASPKEEAVIVVQFNHPVVPLVASDSQGDLPQPFDITPTIAGEGRWLNTATFAFQPSEDLPGATRFTVGVKADLTDVLGARLPEPVTFAFTTAGPQVVAVYPPPMSQDAGATRPISITFNQAMDHASVAAAFTVAGPDDREHTGAFEWLGNTAVFRPEHPLERDSEYVARLDATARAARGDASLAVAERWTFGTAPRPLVVRTEPADGERGSERLRSDGMAITFNTPMRTDSLTVTVQPTIANQSLWWNDDDRVATIGGDWLASRAYTVTVPAATESRSGDPLDGAAQVRFTVAPMAPYVTLRTSGRFGLHNAYEEQVQYLDAVNTTSASLTLHDVGTSEFLDMTVGEAPWDRWDKFRPAREALVREWSVDTSADIDVVRRVSTTLSSAADGRLANGLYMVQQSSPEGADRYLAVVSTANLVLKHGPTEALVWATDLRTGAPVAGLPVAIFDTPDAPLSQGVTDRDGVFRGTFPARSEPWRPLAAIAEAGGRVVAAVGSEWSDGIDPYAFGFGYDAERRPFFANLYTDRPVYRAGQTVYYRGVIRADSDAEYALPEIDRVHVTVRDSNYETVSEADLAPGAFGTVHGEVALPPAARLGDYQIELTVPRPVLAAAGLDAQARPGSGGEDDGVWVATAGFRVSAYRKPEYEVLVETDRAEYRQGETIRVTASASYYFGGAVADAEVRWRLLVDDFFFAPEVEGWWDWLDYDLREERYNNAQGEVLSEGEGTTDADGRLTFELPADVSDVPLSQVFTVDVEITDLNHQVVAGRTSAVVHKADLYLGVRPTAYVSVAGAPAAFELLALDPTGHALGDRSIDLSFFQRTWYSVKERREDGDFYWTSHYTDTLVADSTVVTDADGRATASFTPREGGVHRLVAKARDADGNEAQSATYAWVTGRRYVNWRQENNDRIALVADKKSYAPGDTASVLVPAPFAGGTALVTVERGQIRDVEVLTLPGNSETVRIPIRADYVPNVYISVVLVKGVAADSPLPQFKLGYTNLSVSTDAKLLDVSVQPDRTGTYGPREKVVYDIRVADHVGQPVQAELSLALVDKALLALADDTSVSLADAFYGQRQLSIQTSASLTESVARLNQELAAEKKGGGGGLTEAGTVRRLFRDTAFWDAAVVTDRDGAARVTVDLPDNLTTWRLDARAVSGADTLIGRATTDIVTSRPVLVRPVVPRFLVVGDAVQLETVVNNGTERDVSVAVSLAAVGLEVEDPSPQDVVVPAKGKAKVVWSVRVPGDRLRPPAVPGAYAEATVQMAATGVGADDTVELSLPVYSFAEAEVVATSGEVVDRAVTEHIALPADADRSQGGLTVALNPSLAAVAADSLTWLESFPYDCSEQTTSKFLPNVATYEVLKQLGRADAPELEARLSENVAMAVQRLSALQNADGGWGWWSGESSRPWLTAYALFGLSLAERAGFGVSSDATARGESYLQASLDRPVDVEAGWDADTRAFVIYVLAERGVLPASRAATLFERRAALRVESKAFLALAMSLAEPGERTRVDALLADIGSQAVTSAGGAHWPAGQADPWSMADDLRSTAVVVYALARLDPSNVHLTPAVRWLMLARRESHWPTTQDTAWSVLALDERMRATGELEGRYNYHVALNDAELGKGTVTAENVDQTVAVTAAAADMAASGPNSLVIRRDGPGRLYYDAALRTYRPAESLPALDRGIIVGRRYYKVDPRNFTPFGQPVDTAALGTVVQVKLTLVAPTALHYVLVEDPLPAGFEIIDTSLKTTSAAARSPQMAEVTDGDEDDGPWWQRHWWSYWVDSQLKDEKVALFATYLPAGTYEYTYLIRAGVAGNFNVIPARAEQMYFPDVFGRSAGGVFTVTSR